MKRGQFFLGAVLLVSSCNDAATTNDSDSDNSTSTTERVVAQAAAQSGPTVPPALATADDTKATRPDVLSVRASLTPAEVPLGLLHRLQNKTVPGKDRMDRAGQLAPGPMRFASSPVAGVAQREYAARQAVYLERWRSLQAANADRPPAELEDARASLKREAIGE
jgi:hypothetical protein